MIFIYSILSVSLNLVSGYAGLISMAHSAFYGIGAYISAIMAFKYQSPFLINFVSAVSLCSLFGALVGIPSLRIRDDYFVIATVAFQIIIFNILNNWVSLTNGPMGISVIQMPIIFGVKLSSHLEFLILIGTLSACIYWISYRVVCSPFGRVLKAIREDEVFALAAGKNIAIFKVLIFVISSGMAGAAGVMYSYYISFIDPTSFTVMESIFIITIVIIGGAGKLFGSVAGAIILVLIPEILRFIGIPSTIEANIRQIIYGGMLVAFIIWRPKGLFGDYIFYS
jgi:branched-chain amino acid transport system permease protein